MIITHSSSDSKSNSTQATADYGATTVPTSPSYSMGSPPASSSAYLPLSMPPPYQDQAQAQDRARRRSAFRRFFKALLFAAGLYLIISLVIRSFKTSVDDDDFEGVPQRPIPADGEILECFSEGSSNFLSKADVRDQTALDTAYPYKTHFSFSIPSSSDLIYFMSRGDYGHGSLEFIVSDQAGDDVKVDVVAEYYRPRVLKSSNVCLLSRKNNERGIGFYTPKRWGWTRPYDMIRFTTVIKFPRSRALGQEPLTVKGLESQMDNWSHSLSLDNLVRFNHVSLSGSNAAIDINSVLLEDSEFSTSNAAITGTFTVSDKLLLTTSNGRIDIDLIMQNEDGSRATTAELRTSNAAIKAPIRLVSEKNDSDKPATFVIKAESNNGPLLLSFPEASTSPFPILTLDGLTTNAPIETHLHPTFEGKIVLESTLNGPALEQSYVSDPSGQGRQRLISTERVRGNSLTANVKWGESSPAGKSSVSLRNTNAPNTLYL